MLEYHAFITASSIVLPTVVMPGPSRCTALAAPRLFTPALNEIKYVISPQCGSKKIAI
jgi:hypothetical protein